MAALRYLADTNILVRLVKRNDPEFSLVRGALRALLMQSARLCYTPQTMAEFWNVSTRPAIPAEPSDPVITVSAALAFRKHRCENTP